MTDITKFVVGQTYATRSIGDADCIFSFTILARTDKTVTVEVHDKRVRRGLNIWEGVEQFKPFGTYSMCAVIRADKDAKGSYTR
jgi:hypothetical protein